MRLFFIGLLLYGIFPLQAQDKDARLWLYFGIEKKLHKKVNFGITVQNRLSDNWLWYNQLNVNPEITIKFNRKLRWLVGYVSGLERKKEGYFIHFNQGYTGFQWREAFGAFKLVYRQIVQTQTSAGYNRDKAGVLRWYDRNKLTLRYQLNRRIEPFVATEVNVVLYDTQRQLGDLSRYRCFIGVNIQLTKVLDMENYLMFQEGLSGNSAGNQVYVFGISLNYRLN